MFIRHILGHRLWNKYVIKHTLTGRLVCLHSNHTVRRCNKTYLGYHFTHVFSKLRENSKQRYHIILWIFVINNRCAIQTTSKISPRQDEIALNLTVPSMYFASKTLKVYYWDPFHFSWTLKVPSKTTFIN